MPYVDQGESKPRPTMPPIVPFAAVFVAGVVSVGAFWFFYENLSLNQWLAPIITGPLIGVALRFSSSKPIPRVGMVAVIATLVSCLLGYVLRHVLWIKWLDPTFEPSVGHALNYLFSADLMSILLFAMSAYLSFTIAAAIPKAASPANQA